MRQTPPSRAEVAGQSIGEFRAKCLNSILAALSDGADRVHLLRVQCKRFAALLPLIRDSLNGTRAGSLRKRVNAIRKSLSGVRDDQAIQKVLLKLIARAGEKLSSKDARWLGDYYARRPRVLSDEKLARLDQVFRAAAQELMKQQLREARTLRTLLESAIARSYRKARTRYQRARASGKSRELHDWRTSTKRLHLQLEFARLNGLISRRARSRRMDRMQSQLGGIRDLLLAEKLRFQSRTLPGPLRRVLRQKRRAAEKQALRDGKAIFRDTPEEFVRSCFGSAKNKKGIPSGKGTQVPDVDAP